MAITAARLGKCPLTLDWTNLARIHVPEGEREQGPQVWQIFREQGDRGDLAFFRAPADLTLSRAEEVQDRAAKLAAAGGSNCLVIADAGLCAGLSALLHALHDKRSSTTRFHFVSSADPSQWNTLVSSLDPAETLICFADHTGSTTALLAPFLCALGWLGSERWKTHVTLFTDPTTKGDLSTFSEQNDVPLIKVHASFCGPFGIVGPPALFVLSLAGLSTTNFLTGCQLAREALEKATPEKNPLGSIGNLLLKNQKKRPVHAWAAASMQLAELGLWFAHLWSWALVRGGKGFTAVPLPGTAGQHSLLQLLCEGPDDKVAFFVAVDEEAEPAAIPRLVASTPVNRVRFGANLAGRTLKDLRRIGQQSAAVICTRQNRPHISLQIDSWNEKSAGSLCFFFLSLSGYLGTALGFRVNDLPAHEFAENQIRQALNAEPLPETADSDQSPVARLRGRITVRDTTEEGNEGR